MHHIFTRWTKQHTIFASAVVALAAAAPLLFALTNPTGSINEGRLNVRQGPGKGYTPITSIGVGDDFEIVGRTSDNYWLHILAADGVDGWIASSTVQTTVPFSEFPVTAESEPFGFVNTGRLNMRTGPGTTYPIITTLDQYTEVGLIARSTDGVWFKVRYNTSTIGWMHAGYIGSNVPVASIPKESYSEEVPEEETPEDDTTGEALTTDIYDIGIAAVPELNVYETPGVTSAVIAGLPSATQFPLTGRDASLGWVRIVLDDGREGWVNANNIGTGIPIGDLPVVEWNSAD